jgi:hypothetical protein
VYNGRYISAASCVSSDSCDFPSDYWEARNQLLLAARIQSRRPAYTACIPLPPHKRPHWTNSTVFNKFHLLGSNFPRCLNKTVSSSLRLCKGGSGFLCVQRFVSWRTEFLLPFQRFQSVTLHAQTKLLQAMPSLEYISIRRQALLHSKVIYIYTVHYPFSHQTLINISPL